MIRPGWIPIALAIVLAVPAHAAGTAAAPSKSPAHAAATAPAKAPAAHAAVAPTGDNAPFFSGKPTAKAWKAAQEVRIARAKAAIAKMLAVQGPRTVDNTLRPYDEAGRMLDMAGNQSYFLSEVSPDKPTRETGEQLAEEVEAYVNELSLRRDVYDALAAIDLSSADDETRYYVQHTLLEFRLSGVDKDDSTRAHIQRLNDQITDIGLTFDRNIREDSSTVTCTVAELDGLPQDFIDGHKPGPDGKVTLSINYPDAVPVFSYAKSEDLRKRMYMAYNNRAYPANIAVLDSLREKRYQLALLTGFTNYADYETADKMAGTAATAREFIDRVVAASADRQAREYQQLLARKQKDVPGATTVNFWEVNYYKEQVRKSEYDFDSQALRPYFPYDRVKQGVLDVASKLFSVEFRRVPNAPVWDPSVECYELYDGGKLAGRFYLDMHPRPNKYNHAAQFDIRCGVAGRQIPEGALVCNLPAPTKGNPGLCEMDDVNTFFHEFGHLLHNMFAGRHRWEGIGGIKTEQDFVEAPSQMLEEWMRNAAVLQTFARHYQTGAMLPDSLVQKGRRAEAFARALDVRRQMVYAALSLAAYDRDPSTVSTDDLFKQFVQKYQPFPYVDGTHFQCAFTHLNGYSAGYYTYMWSLVIAKDMFSQFDEKNLLDPVIAKRYRDTVLAPGGSEPAAKFVAKFLGRPFNEEAWKKWLDSND